MKRLIVAASVAASLAAPATAAASPTPSEQDRTNAAQECRAEHGTEAATIEAFTARYGNFGTCVSRRSRDEHAERHEAVANAAQECAAERGDTPESQTAFRRRYGGESGLAAFGRCGSQTPRAQNGGGSA